MIIVSLKTVRWQLLSVQRHIGSPFFSHQFAQSGQITTNLNKLGGVWLLVTGKNQNRETNKEGARQSSVSLLTVTVHTI